MTHARFPFQNIHVANDEAGLSAPPSLTAPAAGESAPWFDPGWLIRRTLVAEADTLSASAEDALLVWLLRLPAERDPAEAAGRVLHAYRPAQEPDDPLARRLYALLEETRGYTPERLARVHAARRGSRHGDA